LEPAKARSGALGLTQSLLLRLRCANDFHLIAFTIFHDYWLNLSSKNLDLNAPTGILDTRNRDLARSTRIADASPEYLARTRDHKQLHQMALGNKQTLGAGLWRWWRRPGDLAKARSVYGPKACGLSRLSPSPTTSAASQPTQALPPLPSVP
jgi:hypothetical protein